MEQAVEVRAPELPAASLETLKRLRTENCNSSSADFRLQSFQLFLRRILSPDSPTRNMLLFHGTGVGKCHGYDTQILMYDGSIRAVQDVLVGDTLMGDDSTPRQVMSLARGRDEMFKVTSANDVSYTVNREHILCLKQPGHEQVVEMTVDAFLKTPNNLQGYRTAVEFENKPVESDPYTFGLTSTGSIPDMFKLNSREVRLQFLAGLLDATGKIPFHPDNIFIVRSLGLKATIKDNIIVISGNIPTRRPRRSFSGTLNYDIQATSIGEGDYYGFTLNGNNRYVLGDFSVTHNTCTAIQVAEEYILRPEFQDKKVLVLASAAVQENFRTQVFDVTRVKQDPSGLLMSQQCTGRRYIEMLERAQVEGLRWENPENREKLNTIIQSMIDDFYDFKPYQGWANTHERKRLVLSPTDYAKWIHETYDDRLIIVDEAHNLREDEESNKAVSDALTKITQIAKGMTLVLLSATPMFDKFDEILFFFNLFLWNDHRQLSTQSLKSAEIFNKDGSFKRPETESLFKGWCHEYISYLRGENPFTFPFRLPPPEELVGKFDRTTDIKGVPIKNPRKYLPLCVSYLQSPQKEAVAAIAGTIRDSSAPTIVVSPDGRALSKCFEKGPEGGALYKYAKDVPPFLNPTNLPKYAAKFDTIMKCITDTSGIVFVYSNLIRGGVLQFAMALEESGFEPAIGQKVLETTYSGASRGKYAFLTSDTKEKQIEQLIRRLRAPSNSAGSDIKVILGSPLISEGIDFKFVRQVHILDPWYNMSRIEQIIGRGLRTCSHSSLPFEDQNCTVYLHITRYSDSSKETYDEFMYRMYVEEKAIMISKIKRIIIETAIDCTLQLATNMLPEEWKSLPIPQRRSQDSVVVTLPLSAMSAPTFNDGTTVPVCINFAAAAVDADYVRPLGTYFDIRDEVFDKLISMFETKPIWSTKDLLKSKDLKYAPEVVQYLVQDAVHSHLKLKDSKGRIGILENREGMYAFTPSAAGPNATMVERSTVSTTGEQRYTMMVEEEEEEPEEEEPTKEEKPIEKKTLNLDQIKTSYVFPFDTAGFTDEVKLWYIIDQKLLHADKVELLKTSPDAVWARGIVVDGPNFIAVSPTEIFNSEGTLIEPVGAEKDAVKLWVTRNVDKIVDEIKNNNKILCTSEDQTLKFAAFDVVDGHVSRIKRSKTIAPKACPFFVQSSLTAMVKDCTGSDFPPSVKTKEVQCIYLSLAVRAASLAKSPHIVWVSPEIWSFLSKESASIRSSLA